MYRPNTIFIFSFWLWFTLNSTSNPTPAFTSNPPIIIGNENIFDKYSSVKATDDAQFGISPIRHAINILNIGSFAVREYSVSSPINSIMPLPERLRLKSYIIRQIILRKIWA